MKKRAVLAVSGICFCFLLAVPPGTSFHEEETNQTALLLIDIQDFYFPGGRSELSDPEEASLKAKKLLRQFREKDLLVIHVRHNAKTGAEIQ